MKEFTIRASQAGKIMGVRALGKTGEGYAEQWIKEQIYKRKYEFTSKYTDKGNINEDQSIDFICNHLEYGMLIKNELHLSNEYMEGTPDIITSGHIIDVKNSWDCFTFPFFSTDVPNMDYYYQGQVYMELTEKDHYKLIYVLSDTPIHLIEREAYYWCKNNGYDDLEESIFEKFVEKMTYRNVPDEMKIKVFEFDRDQKVIDKIKERVIECREHIKSLTDKLDL